MAGVAAATLIAGGTLVACSTGGEEPIDYESIAAADNVLAELALRDQAERELAEAEAANSHDPVMGEASNGMGGQSGSDDPLAGVSPVSLPDTEDEDTPDPWWWLDSPPSADAAVSITNVSVERHDGFDRVVLDMSGTGRPGWAVEKVDTAVDDGSGLPVEIAGLQFLLLRIAGVEFPPYASSESAAPMTIRVNGRAVIEVAKRFWFEGNVNTFIGLQFAGEPEFEVGLLHDPLALFVDIAHP